MDMRSAEVQSAYDAAVAQVLRGRMAELRMTRAQLEAASGISRDTFRWYLTGERPIRMGAFFALAAALEIEPGHVAELASAIVASATGE